MYFVHLLYYTVCGNGAFIVWVFHFFYNRQCICFVVTIRIDDHLSQLCPLPPSMSSLIHLRRILNIIIYAGINDLIDIISSCSRVARGLHPSVQRKWSIEPPQTPKTLPLEVKCLVIEEEDCLYPWKRLTSAYLISKTIVIITIALVLHGYKS
jgi:hypothetical protein